MRIYIMWSLFLNYQNKQGFLKIENTVAKEAYIV